MSVQTIKSQKSKIKNGFTLLELATAGVLLAAALVVSVQVLGWIALERRAAERRQWAAQEVSNVMEHLVTRSWDELTADAAQSVQLSQPASEVLPGPELHAYVTISETEPAAKRITVELRWRNRAGDFDSPVRVSTWVYRRGGGAR